MIKFLKTIKAVIIIHLFNFCRYSTVRPESLLPLLRFPNHLNLIDISRRSITSISLLHRDSPPLPMPPPCSNSFYCCSEIHHQATSIATLLSMSDFFATRFNSTSFPAVNWLEMGNPWETVRNDVSYPVKFYEKGMSWNDVWEINQRIVAYTNHMVLSEALEKWSLGNYAEITSSTC